MRAALILFTLCWAGCSCRNETLIKSGGPGTPATPTAPGLPTIPDPTRPPGFDAGAPAVDAGPGIPNTAWCASDCDCAGGTRCIATTGEPTTNECLPGTNTCPQACASPCLSGTQCVGGTCVVTPCVGTNCQATNFPVSVNGTWQTAYELDIKEFASRAANVGKLITILSAALSGNVQCGAQTTPEDRLICIAVSLVAQNIHAPPWVQQLLNVLSGVFKFGSTPVKAKGTLQLAESASGALTASEKWKELWLEYNGQVLNVMNSPTLGTNGQIEVTVRAFGGGRSIDTVVLGPREIEFDVNKLIINLLNVAISAASNNQASDVEGLLKLVLCNPLPVLSSNYLLCTAAAKQLADSLELQSGLGGIRISQQKALLYDDDNDGIADALARPNARGSVAGSMGNGFVSGALGPFPASNWYGVR